MDYSFQWPPLSTNQEIMRGLPDYFTEEAINNVEKDITNQIIYQFEEASLICFIIFRLKEKECEILWMAVDLKHQRYLYTPLADQDII